MNILKKILTSIGLLFTFVVSALDYIESFDNMCLAIMLSIVIILCAVIKIKTEKQKNIWKAIYFYSLSGVYISICILIFERATIPEVIKIIIMFPGFIGILISILLGIKSLLNFESKNYNNKQ